MLLILPALQWYLYSTLSPERLRSSVLDSPAQASLLLNAAGLCKSQLENGQSRERNRLLEGGEKGLGWT